MPTLPPIANLVKIALHYALEGAVLAVTRHFVQGSTATANANLNGMANSVASAWKTNMAPVTMPNTVLYFVSCEDLSSPVAGTGNVAVNYPGTISGGLNSPSAAAMVIDNLVNLRQRGGHSRVFLPGMDGRIINNADNGEWTAGGANSVLAAWQAYLTAVKALAGPAGYSTLAHVMPHYYKGNAPYIDTHTNRAHNKPVLDTGNIQAYGITGTGVSITIGTQARRNS